MPHLRVDKVTRLAPSETFAEHVLLVLVQAAPPCKSDIRMGWRIFVNAKDLVTWKFVARQSRFRHGERNVVGPRQYLADSERDPAELEWNRAYH